MFPGESVPGILLDLLVAEGDAPLVPVEVEDDHFDLLPLLQHFAGVAHLARPGEVRDVHEAVDPVLEFDEGPEGDKVADHALVPRVGAVLRLEGFPGILLGLFQAEADLLVFLVDTEDHHLDIFALADDLVRVLDMLRPAHLADMHQPLDAGFDLDEGAVLGEADHAALHLLADLVLAVDLVPQVGVKLLQAEADPLALLVVVEDLDADLLVELYHFARVRHPAPGEVGDVQQTVHAAEVDEDAEVGDVLHRALEDVAHLERTEELLAHLAQALLLEHLVADDDVLPQVVDLEDAEVHLRADICIKVAHRAHIDLASGQEGIHAAEVDHHAALDTADAPPADDPVGGVNVLHAIPDPHEVRLALRQQELALAVLDTLEEHLQGVADLQAGRIIELLQRNGALGLEPDVDRDLLLADGDDLAGDDLAFLDFAQAVAVELLQLPALFRGVLGVRREILEADVLLPVPHLDFRPAETGVLGDGLHFGNRFRLGSNLRFGGGFRPGYRLCHGSGFRFGSGFRNRLFHRRIGGFRCLTGGGGFGFFRRLLLFRLGRVRLLFDGRRFTRGGDLFRLFLRVFGGFCCVTHTVSPAFRHPPPPGGGVRGGAGQPRQ